MFSFIDDSTDVLWRKCGYQLSFTGLEEILKLMLPNYGTFLASGRPTIDGVLLLLQATSSNLIALTAKSLWFAVVFALQFKFSGASHNGLITLLSDVLHAWRDNSCRLSAAYASASKVIMDPSSSPFRPWALSQLFPSTTPIRPWLFVFCFNLMP